MNEDLEILKLVHDTHRNEMNYHREVMNKTIHWATNVFLAISGGILALGPSKWNSFGDSAKWTVTVIVIVITIYVIIQILHSSNAVNDNAKIVVKTDGAMKLFESNKFGLTESIYPLSWKDWGGKKKAGYYENLHIFIALCLGISVLSFAWLI